MSYSGQHAAMHVIVEQKTTTTKSKYIPWPSNYWVVQSYNCFLCLILSQQVPIQHKTNVTLPCVIHLIIMIKPITMVSAWNLNGRDPPSLSSPVWSLPSTTVPKFNLLSHLRQQPVAGDCCLRKAPGELQKIENLPTSNIEQDWEFVEGEQRMAF